MTTVRAVRIDQGKGAHVRAFIRMARPLYRPYPLWVPPLERDLSRTLDPRAYVEGSAAAFFVALNDDRRVVGRVGVFDHRRYNEQNGTARAFFNLFEAEDDPRVATALFDAAADWARTRGLDSMEGPRGMGLMDGLGLLVEGFEHPPAFGIPYNPPYYERMLREVGFVPRESWRSGYLDRRSAYDPRLRAIAERVKKDGYEIAKLRGRRDLRRWIPQLLEAYNLAVADVPGWVTMTPAEADQLASQLLWFADLALIKILLHRGTAVGFVFAYPDVSAGLRAAGGRLRPLGWARLLHSRLTTPVLNINGLGLIPQHQGSGGVALLASELTLSILASRYELVDAVQMGEDNEAIKRLMRRIGIRWVKTHRTFDRELAAPERS